MNLIEGTDVRLLLAACPTLKPEQKELIRYWFLDEIPRPSMSGFNRDRSGQFQTRPDLDRVISKALRRFRKWLAGERGIKAYSDFLD